MSARSPLRLVMPAVALTFLAATSLRSTASDEAPPLRTILTIYWSSESFPGTEALDAVIQQGVQSHSERIDYFAEYLESDRFPDEEATQAFEDYIRRKYHGRRIDVVIAVTDVALQFALRYRQDLFPDAPIVFAAVAGPEASVRDAGPGVTGILSGPGFGETLQLALTLHPSTTRIFYVAHASDPVLRESMRAALHAVAKNVQLTDITETSVTRVLDAVRAVPRDSLVLFVRYSQDDAGNVLFPSQIVPLVTEASSAPVYGVAESYLGSGIVGGVMPSVHDIGSRLAEMTRHILAGTRPQDIPIGHAPLVPILDWRQLRRWHIAESSLPPDSRILFREMVWERYKAVILISVSVLAIQSLLIAGLVLERNRRRKAEIESRRNIAAMAHLDRRAAMGELATSLAHELSQPLNAILQNAGVAQMMLTTHPPPSPLAEIVEIISDIRKDNIRASEVIRRMRGLLQKHELESQPVDLNGLIQETVPLVWPEARGRAIQLETDLGANVHPVMGDRVHLQQVLLNLLMNAVDAVAAMPPERRRVRVWSSQTDGEVRVAVSDTGAGIPTDRIADIFEPFYTTKVEGTGMGMGLAIARSIVEAHNGNMAAENNERGGATVSFSVPISPQPAGD